MKAERSLEAQASGQRLDIFLSENLGISRSQARKLIESSRVRIEGALPKAGYRLSQGQTIEVLPPLLSPEPVGTGPIPLKIVYKDDDLLVVDKSAGLVVHPGAGHPSGTLANAVLPYINASPGGTDERPGIVHRLDKNTSGLMIIARNVRAHEFISEQFKAKKVQKTYLALVEGMVRPSRGYIEAPIGRHHSDRVRMAVTAEGRGRQARTGYRVIEYPGGKFSLLEIKPETGRTHQIRVHLAAISHPVVGDVTYGAQPGVLDRQFLHAQKLAFILPSNLQEVEFASDLPADLVCFLKHLRLLE